MDIQRTAEYWDRQHLTSDHHRKEWSVHPLTFARQEKLLGGLSLEQWFRKHYLPDGPAHRGMSVGVGTAAAELRMIREDIVEQYDLYDISQKSLDKACADARLQGIEDRVRFLCHDINEVTLPSEAYDLVTFFASLHHMERLEETLRAAYRALKPGGLFFAAEYVGPDRFNYPDEDTVVAKRLYDVIAPELKHPLEPKLRWPTPVEVIANDPTEAVHSSEILATVERVFSRVDIKPNYGTLPFILFWCLNADALYETEKGRELVQLILDVDMALVDAGRLPSYFAYIVGFKPAGTEPVR